MNLQSIADPQQVFFFLSAWLSENLVNFPLDASLLEAVNWRSFQGFIYKWQCVLQYPLWKSVLPCVWHVEGGTSATVCMLALCDKPFKQWCRLHMNHPAKICLTPQVYVLHFWQLRKNQPPGMPVCISQLGSRGVLSHILGTRANFWSYYTVFV